MILDICPNAYIGQLNISNIINSRVIKLVRKNGGFLCPRIPKVDIRIVWIFFVKNLTFLYVDTFEPEEEIDLNAVAAEIRRLQAEIKDIDAELKPFFEELGLDFPFGVEGE